jgi:hypothetical protein
MRWQPLCFFLLCCTACHNSPVRKASLFKIGLSKDSQTVCISGLEYAIIQDLKADSLTQDTWKSLFAVYRKSSPAIIRSATAPSPLNLILLLKSINNILRASTEMTLQSIR